MSDPLLLMRLMSAVMSQVHPTESRQVPVILALHSMRTMRNRSRADSDVVVSDKGCDLSPFIISTAAATRRECLFLPQIPDNAAMVEFPRLEFDTIAAPIDGAEKRRFAIADENGRVHVNGLV
jgi:hypothetical protein